MPEGTIILPDTTLLTQVMPNGRKRLLANTALSNSPELQQTDLSVQMNRQQEKITRAERRPQIAFVAANHFDGPITIEVPPIDRNFNYWYVGVGVKYNISIAVQDTQGCPPPTTGHPAQPRNGQTTHANR